MTDRGEYDYVIVGGGTAGCILAARLSEDPAITVLLLEAGGSDRSWKVRMPSAYDYLFKNEKFNWCYAGEPEPALGGRQLYQPRGKVLGGSSSINGLGFIRGHPLDFERWAAEGASGWSYREVLPYFRRSECWDGGANPYRGGDGPVRVITPACKEPLYAVFLEAGRAAGMSTLRGSERRRCPKDSARFRPTSITACAPPPRTPIFALRRADPISPSRSARR